MDLCYLSAFLKSHCFVVSVQCFFLLQFWWLEQCCNVPRYVENCLWSFLDVFICSFCAVEVELPRNQGNICYSFRFFVSYLIIHWSALWMDFHCLVFCLHTYPSLILVINGLYSNVHKYNLNHDLVLAVLSKPQLTLLVFDL